MYVLDNRNARVQVFNAGGQLLRHWGDFGDQFGQFVNPFGIAVDAAGNVYVADTGNQRIQKFTSTGEFLTAWGSAGSADSQFSEPYDLAIDSAGNVYVADYGNHRVQVFDTNGSFLRAWGSEGAAAGQLRHPSGIALTDDNAVYVLEMHNHRVQQFQSDGTSVRIWGSEGNAAGQFSLPESITADANGNIYVADTSNNRVQQFSSSGDFVRTWGSQSELSSPTGISTAAGLVYVATGVGFTVRSYNSNGQFINAWGEAGDIAAKLWGAEGVAVAPDGSIFVADTNYHRVLKFSPDWELLQTIGSWSQSNVDGDFNSPRRIAFDSQGNFYVSDGGNGRIQQFDAAGNWLRSLGSPGSAPGQFNQPEGLAVDSQRHIYVADTANNRVQKYAAGQWQVWGGPGSAPGQFANPEGLAVDGNDNVYVADGVNYRVQKFQPDGSFVTSWQQIGADVLGYPHDIAVDSSDNIYVSDARGYVHRFTAGGQWQATIGTPGSGRGELRRPEGLAFAAGDRLFVADAQNDRIQQFRPQPFSTPIATIVAAGPRSVVQGQPVALQGMGSDSDETPAIAAYEWRLNDNPTPFATSATATLDTSSLAPGRHIIELRVRDTENDVSAPQQIRIDVSPANSTEQPSTWTFLLYLAGDNRGIDTFLNRDTRLGALYRLENGIANPRVQIAALYDGEGAGNSFYYLIGADGSFRQFEQGEVNMGDPQTLIDFVEWGKEQAPADHYYLAIADHANALDGIAWDFTSAAQGTERLSNQELRQALIQLTENGGQPFDVLHLDGCLMGLVEIAYQFRDQAGYLVAAQNLGWSAFAYDTNRQAIGPNSDPRSLALAVADRYAGLVAERDYPYTISALDMTRIYPIQQAVDRLATELDAFTRSNPDARIILSSIRNQVQLLDSSGDILLNAQDEYIDLDHWAELIRNGIDDPAVRAAADHLRSEIASFVIREHSASGSYNTIDVNLDNARGIGIYYPPTHSARTNQQYRNELNFAADTFWDEFLTTELSPLSFDPAVPPPNPVAPLPFEHRFEQAIYLPLIVLP